MICANCHGSGRIPAWRKECFTGRWVGLSETYPCPACGGHGVPPLPGPERIIPAVTEEEPQSEGPTGTSQMLFSEGA